VTSSQREHVEARPVWKRRQRDRREFEGGRRDCHFTCGLTSYCCQSSSVTQASQWPSPEVYVSFEGAVYSLFACSPTSQRSAAICVNWDGSRVSNA